LPEKRRCRFRFQCQVEASALQRNNIKIKNMGLLDGILGSLLGGLNQQQSGNLLSSVAGLLQNCGGIQGLLSKFNNQGLGDLVKGWISTGPNPPATAQQVEQVFGAEQLSQMAAQAGVPVTQISEHIAKLLPQLVDKLTPNGVAPEGNLLQQGLSSLLSGGIGKLFGGK
jgi:uncharacterized protein YidB (DUF937 family)